VAGRVVRIKRPMGPGGGTAFCEFLEVPTRADTAPLTGGRLAASGTEGGQLLTPEGPAHDRG